MYFFYFKIDALKKSDKMKLSELDLSLIKCFMDIDENNHVHYKNAARLVGELIKRFFSPKMISLKTKFDKIRIVT